MHIVARDLKTNLQLETSNLQVNHSISNIRMIIINQTNKHQYSSPGQDTAVQCTQIKFKLN